MSQTSIDPAQTQHEESIPLCVDLDGTLIRSDLLVESALALVARNPLALFYMFVWLLRGKAHLKHEIARRVKLDASTLPYNPKVVEWIRSQQEFRPVVLCTASDANLANDVANHIGGFSNVLASDGVTNLSGINKCQALLDLYGNRGFDYVGNAQIDLRVWKHARSAIVVESDSRLSAAAARVTRVERVIATPGPSLRLWIKALRMHQWIKNVLVFLPLLASHRILDVDALIYSGSAFFGFSLCASSVYLTNDLLDLAADRTHHRKRHRPFAAGTLPLIAGLIVAIALLIGSLVLAWLITPAFLLVLLGYYVLTTGYSLRFKRVIMLDVIVLATLYTTRILAGAVAIRVIPSFWLLAFSMFIFLSLAMIKRYTELLATIKAGEVKASGRGYDVGDIPLIQSLGGASGYLAVLVLALYIDSAASESIYGRPQLLWLICPILLYWISRAWAIAGRGIMHDDPVVFAIRDRTSQILVVLAAIIVMIAV